MEPGQDRGSAATTAGALSCVTCRARKLKCDRILPICTRCIKAKTECVYPESRRKPAFKRGNVRELEERLAQVEGLLKDVKAQAGDNVDPASEPTEPSLVSSAAPADFTLESTEWFGNAAQSGFSFTAGESAEFSKSPDRNFGELLGLGQFEALPPIEMIEDLHNIFFQKQYHFSPFIHKATYLRSFYSAPHMRPPMCLQYAIWAMASNGHDKYHSYHDVFYRRCRQYLEADELKGYGEHFMTVAHAQTWGLIATDEARGMFFTRASMSCARVVRLVQMMGLHRLDDPMSEENPMAPTLAPPQNWAELEERRRIFWGAFCIDSHAAITTGWPNLIDHASITTHLPSSEEAFNAGREEKTSRLQDAFDGTGYSTFAGAVVVCYLFNRLLRHVHRPAPEDRPDDLQFGEFWKRHRDLDNVLSMAFMVLPERFRLPKNIRDPVAVHKNLNLHACLISLHMTACDKAEEHKVSESIRLSSLTRMLTAAQEIVNIIKLTTHINTAYRSPLASLSMYCAAVVYVRQGRDDVEALNVANLEFLLQCMLAIGTEHLITRAHLQQILLDIENHGLMPRVNSRWHTSQPFGVYCGHNIPLLARTSISRHSKPQPPLPGRLPLNKPQGNTQHFPAWNTTMKDMPWYLGDGTSSTRPTPAGSAAVVVEEEEEGSGPGSKRRRTGHDVAEPNPMARFMELPHRGSSTSSSPQTGSGPTPPTTGHSFDGNPGNGCPGNILMPPETHGCKGLDPGMPVAADPGFDSAVMPGMDLFTGMDQWNETADDLLAQVTEFPGTSTDPWITMNNGGGSGWSTNG